MTPSGFIRHIYRNIEGIFTVNGEKHGNVGITNMFEETKTS